MCAGFGIGWFVTRCTFKTSSERVNLYSSTNTIWLTPFSSFHCDDLRLAIWLIFYGQDSLSFCFFIGNWAMRIIPNMQIGWIINAKNLVNKGELAQILLKSTRQVVIVNKGKLEQILLKRTRQVVKGWRTITSFFALRPRATFLLGLAIPQAGAVPTGTDFCNWKQAIEGSFSSSV